MTKQTVGILIRLVDCRAWFSVEFARSSDGRRGAPTLVLVVGYGSPVSAFLLIVDAGVAEATDRLYRREINAVGSGSRYPYPKTGGRNIVFIRQLLNFDVVDVGLYTDITATIGDVSARELAQRAIKSAIDSDDGVTGSAISSTRNGTA